MQNQAVNQFQIFLCEEYVEQRKAFYQLPERAATLVIGMVIVWDNGIVETVDHLGVPMWDYCGFLAQVERKINNVYLGPWEHGVWRTGVVLRSKESSWS